MPELTLDVFRSKFDAAVSSSKQTWEALGFALESGEVLPFGTDTKVISTVFESLAAAYIIRIANEYGYSVEGSPQTIYPDFTLVPNGRIDKKIAIDIKTTYRKASGGGIVFTLGSYTSFLRDPEGKKNIKYPYAQYSEHWVIGFLYSRLEGTKAKEYESAITQGKLLCPYNNVEYFMQHKHLVAGDKPGSGNTANIGSARAANLNRYLVVPFTFSTKEEFEAHWRAYSK